jgi:hypothetical protein
VTFTYHIVDFRTGVKQLQVFPISGSCDRLLNGAGSGGSHRFQLGVPTDLSWAQWEALTTPWARVLVVSWRGVAKYAGLISRRTRDPESQQLTISHVDLRVLHSSRFIFGDGQYRPGVQSGPKPTDLNLLNLQKYSIIAAILNSTQTGPFGIYSYPIVLAPLVAGTDSRSYHNENFVTVESAMQEIQSANGGPDTDLAPRWTSTGTLEWYQRTGTGAQPLIVGSVVDMNMSASESPAFDVTVTDDAMNQMTGVFAVGNGSGKDMLVEGSGLAGGVVVIPARDTTEQFKEVTDSSILYGHAVAEVNARQFPTQQWSLSIMADGLPGLADIELGSLVSLYFKGEEWIGDGWVRLRCIEYSFDMTGKVDLELQPWRG